MLGSANPAVGGGLPAPEKGGEPRVVVATYKYPNIDRRAAVTPLAELVESVTKRRAEIRVAESPTELADWVITGEADFAVPNLVAYLAIKAASKSVIDLAVPVAEVPGSDADDAYTSSIIVPHASPLESVADIEESRTPLEAVMVWPDSASGALVAGAHLRQELKDAFERLGRRYAGSHQNVLEETANGPGRVGVLATKVYLDALAEADRTGASRPAVREIWRSGPIPFGPLVCTASMAAKCLQLREYLLKTSDESRRILAGLQGGWPEFAGASGFEIAESTQYDALIEIYASNKQTADKDMP
ncbi:MAG: PhnD/SsuA/transferrin family substrate-binding protein [Pseudomonadota bacterium]